MPSHPSNRTTAGRLTLVGRNWGLHDAHTLSWTMSQCRRNNNPPPVLSHCLRCPLSFTTPSLTNWTRLTRPAWVWLTDTFTRFTDECTGPSHCRSDVMAPMNWSGRGTRQRTLLPTPRRSRRPTHLCTAGTVLWTWRRCECAARGSAGSAA